MSVESGSNGEMNNIRPRNSTGGIPGPSEVTPDEINQTKQDLDDFNRELSGNTHKHRRFTSDSDNTIGEKKKNNDGQNMAETLTLIWQQQEAYRRAHEHYLSVAQNAVEFYDQQLSEIQEIKSKIAQVETLRNSFTINLDGEDVLKNENGEYILKNTGKVLEGEKADRAREMEQLIYQKYERGALTVKENAQIDLAIAEGERDIADLESDIRSAKSEEVNNIEEAKNKKLDTEILEENVQATENKVQSIKGRTDTINENVDDLMGRLGAFETKGTTRLDVNSKGTTNELDNRTVSEISYDNISEMGSDIETLESIESIRKHSSIAAQTGLATISAEQISSCFNEVCVTDTISPDDGPASPAPGHDTSSQTFKL